MDLLEIFGVGTNLMFSLGIIFIIVFTLFYLRQRLSDYDSKLKDMIQIISGLNNEIKNIKATNIPSGGNFDNVNQYSQEHIGESKKVQLTTNNYANVIESDEVIEEENNFYVNVNKDNENDSDEDSDEEDSDEENSEEDNEEEVEEEFEEEDEGENVKEITGLEDNLENQVSSLLDKSENTRTVDLSEVVEESKNEDDEDVKLNKMTITELREYAVLKNIAIDPKIKKKSEIVELLESTVESTI